jgi:hypothetical protein
MSVYGDEKSTNKKNDKKDMNELDKPYENGIRVHTPATPFMPETPAAGRPQSRIVTSSRLLSSGPIVLSGQQRCQGFFKS